MKPITPVAKTAKYSSWLAAAIIAMLPFHAFLTVWLSSLAGHYTLLRLWKEILLLPLLAGTFYILFKDAPLRRKLFSLLVTRLILIYLLVLVICGAVALSHKDVTAKAMWYGLLVDTRYLVFFLAVLVIAAKSDWLGRQWHRILFGPAALVTAFAILQYMVLPYDFLKHFGYGDSTISPYETINHNLQHIRVESTLRGANPLGAYLILPLTAIVVLLFRNKKQRNNKLAIAAGLVLALIFSFSRSAWIGAALAVLIAAWLSFRSDATRRKIGISLAVIIVIAGLLGLALRNNLGFENAILHTDKNSKAAVSSNEGHTAAFKSAVKDIYHQPLGGGVGSAGPQSVYSYDGRIAENYFLQIGQEAGVLGMALFIAICAVLGKMLYSRRSEPLALALFAALIGLSAVNLLSHAWEDDTLSYIYWGLSAIALSPDILADRHKRKNGKNIQKKA